LGPSLSRTPDARVGFVRSEGRRVSSPPCSLPELERQRNTESESGGPKFASRRPNVGRSSYGADICGERTVNEQTRPTRRGPRSSSEGSRSESADPSPSENERKEAVWQILGLASLPPSATLDVLRTSGPVERSSKPKKVVLQRRARPSQNQPVPRPEKSLPNGLGILLARAIRRQG
jgi:hypothetical protein